MLEDGNTCCSIKGSRAVQRTRAGDLGCLPWPPISDLELCPYPFPGIRFRLPVCPFSFFRAICPFSRRKTLFPIIFRKMLHFGKFRKFLVKIWSKFSKILRNFAKFCKNQRNFQRFLTKHLRLENGAKECIV